MWIFLVIIGLEVYALMLLHRILKVLETKVEAPNQLNVTMEEKHG